MTGGPIGGGDVGYLTGVRVRGEVGDRGSRAIHGGQQPIRCIGVRSGARLPVGGSAGGIGFGTGEQEAVGIVGEIGRVAGRLNLGRQAEGSMPGGRDRARLWGTRGFGAAGLESLAVIDKRADIAIPVGAAGEEPIDIVGAA